MCTRRANVRTADHLVVTARHPAARDFGLTASFRNAVLYSHPTLPADRTTTATMSAMDTAMGMNIGQAAVVAQQQQQQHLMTVTPVASAPPPVSLISSRRSL